MPAWPSAVAFRAVEGASVEVVELVLEDVLESGLLLVIIGLDSGGGGDAVVTVDADVVVVVEVVVIGAPGHGMSVHVPRQDKAMYSYSTDDGLQCPISKYCSHDGRRSTLTHGVVVVAVLVVVVLVVVVVAAVAMVGAAAAAASPNGFSRLLLLLLLVVLDGRCHRVKLKSLDVLDTCCKFADPVNPMHLVAPLLSFHTYAATHTSAV